MQKSVTSVSLQAATALALVWGATAVYAQMPQKEQGPQSAPTDTQGRQGPGQAQQRTPDAPGRSAIPEKDQSKGKAAQGGEQAEPKDQASKGTAQKDVEPKQKTGKGTAQKGDTKSKDTAASDKTSPSAKGASKAGTQRVPLSEQQQTRVRETVGKERGARVTNVNFSVSVGTRIPRSVRLAPLPAAVIEVVPEYRSYRYVVVRDDIVIIDPVTYEIVSVVPARSTTAGGGAAILSLTEEELAFVLRNIDLKSESRLAIGSLSVGMTLGRDVELREFPTVVVEKLPKLRTYRYLVRENDVAIVDPRESKVVLVKDTRQ